MGGSEDIAWRLLQAGADVELPIGRYGGSYQATPLELARHYYNHAAADRMQYAVNILNWARDGTG